MAAAVNSHASFVVVPGAQASVEGNANNGFPFNIGAFSASSMRYQQGFAASQFSSLSGPALITQIAFRPDANAGAFVSTLSSIQINLSTTTANPNALSSTFASNVGADDTVVFGAGALTLSSSFTGPVGGPKNFDIIITLSTPFLYNPANGNLLLDVRNFGGGFTAQFDAEFGSGDGVSRGYFGNVNSATGSTDDLGLITRFTFESAVVPEPSTYLAGVLVLLPLAASAVRNLRKNRQA